MFLGQFRNGCPFSAVLAAAGVAGWMGCSAITLVLCGGARPMIGVLVLFYSMAAVFRIIVLIDWRGRRKDRQSRNRAS